MSQKYIHSCIFLCTYYSLKKYLHISYLHDVSLTIDVDSSLQFTKDIMDIETNLLTNEFSNLALMFA